MSWEHGQTATFSISGPTSGAEIYQMGMNGQTGLAVAALAVTSTQQPACFTLPQGSADCGNWSVSATWDIPASAPSGLYRLALTPSPSAYADIWFVVRCDECNAPLLVVTSDATWQAYNTYGGGSLYKGDNLSGDRLKGREFRVSYNRPLITSASDPTNTELPLLNWLTANGFDFQYVSQLDLEANPAISAGHKVMMSAGHLEYVSDNQRSAFEQAVANGVSWANLTGNEFYWKIDPQPSIDATAQPNRTIVCDKETLGSADINPSLTWTGTWRDRRWSPPNDGGRPENVLTGQLFTVGGGIAREDAVQFSAQEGQSPFLRNTAGAQLQTGQLLTMPAGTLGYEWDEVKTDNLTLPSNELALSTSVVSNVAELQPDQAGDYSAIRHGDGMTAINHVTLYEAASGAWVWSTGSMQWSWGLSNDHNNGGFQAANVVMQQATLNILTDMGLSPAHPQPGLVVSTPESFAQYQATAVPLSLLAP
jgi:hypothetical protein